MFSSVWTDSAKSQKLSKEVRERISLKDLCLEGYRIKVLKFWGVKTLIEAKQFHLLGGSGAKVTEYLRHWLPHAARHSGKGVDCTKQRNKTYVEGAKDKSTIRDNSRKKRDCRRRKEELEMETAASPTAARWGRRKSQITEE